MPAFVITARAPRYTRPLDASMSLLTANISAIQRKTVSDCLLRLVPAVGVLVEL
jgi:hypothetical protein